MKTSFFDQLKAGTLIGTGAFVRAVTLVAGVGVGAVGAGTVVAGAALVATGIGVGTIGSGTLWCGGKIAQGGAAVQDKLDDKACDILNKSDVIAPDEVRPLGRIVPPSAAGATG